MSEETPVMNVAEKYRKAIDDMAYLYDWSESPDRKRIDNVMSLLSELWIEHTKFPVSSTLDRLLDSRFDTNRQELLDRSIDIVDEMEVGSFTEEMAQELRDTLTMCITPEAEADLGEIEHKGEKVMVKIKVVRGE